MSFLELCFLLTATQPPFPGCSGAVEGAELEEPETSDATLGHEYSAPIKVALLASRRLFKAAV